MTDLSPRLPLAAAVALLGVILVLASESQPVVGEARLGRRVELVELIQAERARVEALSSRVDELAGQLATLEAGHARGAEAVGAVRARVDEVAASAGQTAVVGPGLEVRLTDSPLRTSPSGDLNDLVIHEQDLQAVINALWAGGAEAMTVQGQRVLATTAIRCVGNTLLLHGNVYSPPYVVAAVGDPDGMRNALETDRAVERLARAAKELQLGFTVAAADELRLPGHEGAPSLQVARPAETTQG